MRLLWRAGFLAGGILAGLAASAVSQDKLDIELFSQPVDAGVAEDPGLDAYLRPYREAVQAFASEVVGYAAEPLLRDRPECGVGNFVADALLRIGAEEFGEPIDFSLTNYGGLRRDLPQGPITLGLLMELSPFQNYITYIEVDGRLATRLARAAAKGGVAVSGLEVVFGPEGELLEARIGGRLIDERRNYRVVTIDYLVSTWSDLFDAKLIREKRVSERLIQRDAMVLHLGRLQAEGVFLRDAGDGRIQAKEGVSR